MYIYKCIDEKKQLVYVSLFVGVCVYIHSNATVCMVYCVCLYVCMPAIGNASVLCACMCVCVFVCVPEFGFGCADDAICILHLWATVTGVVELQTVIELVQILLHLLDLLMGHVLQTEAHLRPEERRAGVSHPRFKSSI